MKRSLALLLAVLTLLSTMVFPLYADEYTEEPGSGDIIEEEPATNVSGEEIYNYYDFYHSYGAYINDMGEVTESTEYSINEHISIMGGSTIYFGPCTSGTVSLVTYDSFGSSYGYVDAGLCTEYAQLDDGSVIYSYELLSDVSAISIAAENQYADKFILTEGQPFDSVGYEEYHAIDPLTGKSALFVGDSICHGVKDTPTDHYGWAGRIGEANGMDWVNNGESGYSVSTCRASNYGVIVDKLTEYKNRSFDYVLLHGGVNDAWDAVAVGEITDGYDPAAFDVSTFAGGLEDLIYKTYYYYGRKATVGYLCNFTMPAASNANLNDMSAYFDIAKEICDKWNVRYFDMYNNSKVNADLKVSTSTYLPDYIHPNKGGYDILSPMIEGFMKTLTKTYAPDYEVPEDDGKVYNVTFCDDDGTVLSTTTATRVEGLAQDAPAITGKYNDGIVACFFEGWCVNDELIDTLNMYDFTADVTFTAKYADVGFGARLEGYAPIALSDGSAAQELLPETVALDPAEYGVTWVYKVEGADSTIIADNFLVYINDTGSKWPASQWGDAAYTADDYGAHYLELNNGYYFVYANLNIIAGSGAVLNKANSFSIFNPDVYVGNGYARYVSDRDPVNTNEAATFQMLAVTSGNLQPTVTFHDADGALITSYQHKYTSVTANLGYGTKPLSHQRGELLTADEVFALTGESAPEKAADAEYTYEFIGWQDAQGNAVDGVYYNCDLYPVYKAISTAAAKYNVTFVNDDGTLLYTTEVTEGETPVYEGVAPEKAANAQYSYTFAGWSPELAPATEDAVYTATYTESKRSYTVTFVDDDRATVLGTVDVKYGESAVFADPVKESDGVYTYEFAGWVYATGAQADLSSIGANTLVYASYTQTRIPQMGDANNDGEYNVLDITIVARYISQGGANGKYDLTDCDTAMFDMDGDGVIGQIDLSRVTRLTLAE